METSIICLSNNRKTFGQNRRVKELYKHLRRLVPFSVASAVIIWWWNYILYSFRFYRIYRDFGDLFLFLHTSVGVINHITRNWQKDEREILKVITQGSGYNSSSRLTAIHFLFVGILLFRVLFILIHMINHVKSPN